MGISDKLADLNWQRNQDFSIPFTKNNARPAVYSFNGDVYQGLDAYSISEDKLEQLQDKLSNFIWIIWRVKTTRFNAALSIRNGDAIKIQKEKEFI